MDQNFLQMLGQLQPEDGSANPYAVPVAAPTAVPVVDPNVGAPVNLLAGIPGYGVQQAAAADPTAPVAPQAANVLQALAPGDPNVAPPSIAPAPATQPARARSSLLDTLGRLSDVFAKVGGAPEQYQPTLDARQDRTLALGDHDQQSALNQIKLATAQGELGDAGNLRLSAAARGLQAIVAANPQADVSKIWPTIAAQAGVDPQRAAAIGQQLLTNPEILQGLTQPAKGASYTGQVVYGQDANGKLYAYQPGENVGARNILPDGITPVDPTKVVNTGGETVLVGDKTGKTQRILPNTVAPNTVANNATAENIADKNNATKVTIAGLPARGKGAAGGAASDPFSTYSNSVNSLRSLDSSLSDLTGDPRLSDATGLIAGRLNLTGGQRAIEAKIQSLSGQAIPAAIAAIKSSGGASPRAVSEIMGEAKGLVGAIQNRNQDTSDYVQNIQQAQLRLRQRIQDMTNDAVRQGYASIGKNGQIMPITKPAASAGPATIQPSTPAGGASGWSIVGVQ